MEKQDIIEFFVGIFNKYKSYSDSEKAEVRLILLDRNDKLIYRVLVDNKYISVDKSSDLTLSNLVGMMKAGLAKSFGIESKMKAMIENNCSNNGLDSKKAVVIFDSETFEAEEIFYMTDSVKQVSLSIDTIKL